MKRRLKIYLVIVLAAVGAWTTLNYFSVETMALVWHLQHGFHAELGGIRMRVPLSFQAHSPKGLPELTMIRFGGHVWKGGGLITIDFRHPGPEAMQTIEARLPNKLVTRTRIGERPVTFAGRSGMCVEYIPQVDDSRANQYIQAMNPRDIDCWFGDVGVEMIGTANLKDDFYNIIQTAEPIRRKN